MKPKTIILAVVAVVCGLGAMWMTNRLLAEKQTTTAPTAEAREKVLVAKGKIPAQTVFKDVEKYFEEREVVASAIPPKAIRTGDKVVGKRLSRNLSEGDYVTPEALVNPETDGLGAVIPPGMRAVTIRVQQDANVAGFVLPRSHVDVLCTVRNNEGSTTYTILENMEVLAIDTKSTRAAEGEQVIPGTTATLCATPEDCNLLKMAAQTGVLDLLLRPIGDTTATRPHSVTQDKLKTPGTPKDSGDDTDPVVGSQANSGRPNLPAVPPGTAPVQPAPAAVVAAPEPEMDVFVMTIVTGASQEKVRFVKKKGDAWGTDSATSSSATPPASGTAPATTPGPVFPTPPPAPPAVPALPGAAAPGQRG